MNKHGILHRIVITIGLLLGVTATGVGAKASTNQPSNTNDNNQQTNHLNQRSIQNNKTTLVNQQSQVDHVSKILEQQPKVQTDNQIQNHNDRNQATHYDNSNQNRTRRQPSYQGDNQQKAVGQQTSQLYHHIVSRGVNNNRAQQISNNYRNNNKNNEHTYQVGPRQYSLKSEGAHAIDRARHQQHPIAYKMSHKNENNSQTQNVIHFNQKNNVKRTKSSLNKPVHHSNWFRDGLSKNDLSARNWVSMHESSNRWYVLSYGHVCVGYFQLNPHYLGYRNGHIDLRPAHQVKVADQYVNSRYGNWINAKLFWENHHWY